MSKIYTSYKSILSAFILALTCIFAECSAEEISSSTLNPVKIIDGDSLEIGNSRIRLMGIDAPEYTQYCKNAKKKNYPCGKISTKHLAKIINNQDITCKVHKKDKYDRNLCICYTKDGTDINAEQIRSGNAVTYMETPYKEIEQQAKQQKIGIWQGRFIRPRLFRRLKEQEKAN